MLSDAYYYSLTFSSSFLGSVPSSNQHQHQQALRLTVANRDLRSKDLRGGKNKVRPLGATRSREHGISNHPWQLNPYGGIYMGILAGTFNHKYGRTVSSHGSQLVGFARFRQVFQLLYSADFRCYKSYKRYLTLGTYIQASKWVLLTNAFLVLSFWAYINLIESHR